MNAIKRKVLSYATKSSTFSFLDNNQYKNIYNRFELLVGIGISEKVAWHSISKSNNWVFGHMNYEQDNIHEENDFDFTHQNAFIPEVVIYIPFQENCIYIESDGHCEAILNAILNMPETEHFEKSFSKSHSWHLEMLENEYIDTVEKIRSDIYNGDYYELNLCVKATIENYVIDPVAVFQIQNTINPAPFSALYKTGNHYLICGSPERFLYKNHDILATQPIKGTLLIDHTQVIDQLQIQQLRNDPKELSEHVMIVDLSRNDLAQCCKTGSICVQELFGIYKFPYVFQMISTITGNTLETENFNTIFHKIFPMGSMTGAPKLTVMDHIRKYEKSKRGIYSGSLFYKDPDGNFDSNVVIRSLVYHANSQKLTYHTGGAITYHSQPKKEWMELQWKALSMQQTLLL